MEWQNFWEYFIEYVEGRSKHTEVEKAEGQSNPTEGEKAEGQSKLWRSIKLNPDQKDEILDHLIE